MNIDLGSFAFGSTLKEGAGTCSWGTALGQSQPAYKFTYDGCIPVLTGMMYCSSPKQFFSMPLGKGGKIINCQYDNTIQITSIFHRVYVNGKKIDHPFLMAIVKEESASHPGRRSLKYSDKIKYDDGTHQYSNIDFVSEVRKKFGMVDDACWFVYAIEIEDFDKLVLKMAVADSDGAVKYENSSVRKTHWMSLIPEVDLSSVKFHISESESSDLANEPLQQIFYGAPGTGKSHTVNDVTKSMPQENVYRITFHPDSDYSTFVGCYKPTKNTDQKVVSIVELKNKCKEYYTRAGYNNCNLVQYGYDYAESLKLYCDIEKTITYAQLLSDAGCVDTGATSYITGGMALYANTAKNIAPITYEFVPQSFIKAYVKAMQTPDEAVMLVIEEINRGNCAQIFGDMFQLLDRNEEGLSDYAVKPDTDLEAYLKAELGDKYNENEGMRLPSNLYIWATMNTSDQSLFPIDSAFKRRWEWKYMPIKEGVDKKTGEKLGYKIVLGNGTEYDWFGFIEAMNKKIFTATSSEDKQMGYFFIKAQDGKISADRFVNKVLFYLYNDVFKSYDLPTEFGNKKFTAFFTDTDTEVEELMKGLGLEALGETDTAETTEGTAE